MPKIIDSIFTDFNVDYGGGFFINKQIDLTLNNRNFNNIKTTSYYQYPSGIYTGGSCFIFIGNNFFANGIECFSSALSSASFWQSS